MTKGDKPGRGVFRCTYCWFDIELKEDDHELPNCPVCGGVHFF